MIIMITFTSNVKYLYPSIYLFFFLSLNDNYNYKIMRHNKTHVLFKNICLKINLLINKYLIILEDEIKSNIL